MKMSPVFYAIPTANAKLCGSTFAKWRAMGYRTAALIDGATTEPDNADVILRADGYQGYPWAIKQLCDHLLASEPDLQWIVVGGDDMDPDPGARPAQIADECSRHFHGTLGVMQPTGDPWDVDASGRCAAARICGSPWLGRDFIQRWNGGAGVFWPEYRHFFADEEMHDVAFSAGLLWQRSDLTQWHHHVQRERRPPATYQKIVQSHWSRDGSVFRRRKAAGFPGAFPALVGS
jgi:hypothetical protein